MAKPAEEPFPHGGLLQYTPENCNAAQAILDQCIENLVNAGESASETEKLNIFRTTVLELNELNRRVGDEFLCMLIEHLATEAGIDCAKYPCNDITENWREWQLFTCGSTVRFTLYFL
jgi:hypothetical protein